MGYDRIEDLDDALPADIFRRESLPYVAGFLAGKAHRDLTPRRKPNLAAARLLIGAPKPPCTRRRPARVTTPP